MLKRNQIDTPEVEKHALRVVQDAKMPVSIDYVAQNIGFAWHQTRSLLFRLVAEGKLGMQNTTKSWIFFPQGVKPFVNVSNGKTLSVYTQDPETHRFEGANE